MACVQFKEYKALYQEGYATYFRLHQDIEANKREFAALEAAARSAPTPEERRRWDAQLHHLWRKRVRLLPSRAPGCPLPGIIKARVRDQPVKTPVSTLLQCWVRRGSAPRGGTPPSRCCTLSWQT